MASSHKNTAPNTGNSNGLMRRWKEIPEIMRFSIVVLACIGVFYWLYSTKILEVYILAPFLSFSTSVAAAMLKVIGYEITVVGKSISSKVFSMSVERGCDAMEPLSIFMIVLVAYPSTLMQKVKGIGMGLLLLIPLNIFRIFTLFIIGTISEKWFEIFHISIWQFLFIIITLAYCWWWMKWTNKQASES